MPTPGAMMSATVPSSRIHKLERLLELSRSLSSAVDLESFLQYVVDLACEITLSEASTVVLYEEETDLLKIIAGPCAKRETLRLLRLPLEQSVAGQVYTQSRTIIIQDTFEEGSYLREFDQALGIVTCSILAVPIIFAEKTIGVLETVNKRGKAHYTGEDATFLEALASISATAIFNSLLLEETQYAYENLSELERLKSNFIAITSHELRTPLGLILGHASFLRDNLTDTQQQQQVEVIIRSANHLKKIIEDLSSIDEGNSKTARLRREPVDLDPLIRKIAASFQDTARLRKISLGIKLPKNGLTIEGDEEKISVALRNLVKNSLTFTEENGHVLITAESFGRYVIISVIDDGIGIPAKDLGHVFDRFFQVESHYTRRHGGLGLGLAVAKVMIELHGGQIWVESVEGKGSNFSFLLPCTPEQTKIHSNAFIMEG
jgi:signal transduction histidine kinase